MVMTATAQDEISAFFAADPDAIAWPYPMYARWQQGTGVVRWDDGPATLVTRHRDVKALMGGAFPVIQNGYRHGALAERTVTRLPAGQHDVFFKIMDFESLFMSRNDGPAHARLRRIASRAFTARRIGLLRESIQRHVDDLVQAATRSGPVTDVKTELANKLPVRVINDLLGVPQADREQIWAWSEAIARLFSVDPAALRQADEAIESFRDYVHAMIARMRATGEGPELARTLLDSRASAAPRQKCGPKARDRCSARFGRVMSRRSGSANTSGSRLAAPISTMTVSPASTRRPPSSNGSAATRGR